MVQENEEGQMLLIDKPYRWTSFDVVKKVKHAGRFAKIGHAGTLDPLATGLLILCTGRMTKQIDTYQAQEKEYTGTLVLGKTTPSVDLETAVDQEYPTAHLDEALLRHGARQLTGLLQQVPPMHSAVLVGGERLYKKARRGETVAVQPREVTVSVFELGRIELPEVDFRIVCSKGTYVRSLVRDFGSALRSGAYLAALRRTRIGQFHVSEALTVEAFVHQVRPPNSP
ncbi:MAG: tRNA pseudouridine(55) synthase TruB [Ferruginibacter sp.]|nr:tRNA pseudouridine(55) synthase TruB [Cytophagales bacterium]